MSPDLAALILFAGTFWLGSHGIDGLWFAAARLVRVVRGWAS